MSRMKTTYWSSSKFADRLRGTPKLFAGTAEEWEDWEEKAKKAHPVRYWLAEEFLDWLQDVISYPKEKCLDTVNYLYNRFYYKTHCLNSKLKKGEYHELDTKMLECLMNEMVEFVETEFALMQVVFNDERKQKYNYPKSRFKQRFWRSPEAGLDYIQWQKSLLNDDGSIPEQVEYAKILEDIYIWWTKDYPNRPDPYEVSGWSDYCEERRELNNGKLFGSKMTDELEKKGEEARKMMQDMEDFYLKEETDMLVNLIKIRKYLWI